MTNNTSAVLERLMEIHGKHCKPLRFNQFIWFVQSRFSDYHNDAYKIKSISKESVKYYATTEEVLHCGEEHTHYDLFHVEDSKFLEFLDWLDDELGKSEEE